MHNIPPYIAICGYPGSGKTLVQSILNKDYGTVGVDDALPLREFAVTNLGLTWDQVLTQDGKKEYVEILGRTWQVREILGELGNRFEAMFGKNIMPAMAINRIKDHAYPGASFSFGSVRRDQGAYYSNVGGIVLGIDNPSVGPSPYEFDQFDRSVVDYWIYNDAPLRGLSFNEGYEDLRRKVRTVLEAHAAKSALEH